MKCQIVKGRCCLPPIQASPEGLEKEIWTKASLLTEGIRFDETALEGIRSSETDPSARTLEAAALPNDCPRWGMPSLISDKLRLRKLREEHS